MVKKITEGVCISVEVFYRPDQSNPVNNSYVFMYKITIDNFTNTSIQLLRRSWYIIDTLVGLRTIDGEGVIGLLPILEPNESFQYSSATNIHAEIGKMYGTYFFKRLSDDSTFEVIIPEFSLITPFKGN
ncbi:MAG TPA: Co2+/Mg2+ efflux protein ApaG [Edaphocola sp.]|nr:Co2+/Mg2+ efflux protein ApaG [Edaphocola sp.]